jgi:biotin carboxyl carrier protein
VDDSVWVRRALQIIEKLSVQAPSGEVKLKLMKEIAAEHNIEWDSSDFESELLKAPEDLLDGPPSFLEAHEMPPPTKESLAKPLDNDSMASSTSELPLPPVTQSSPTVQELLKQDDKKQYIPFVKTPAPGKNDGPVPPAAPVVHKTQNYDEATQGKNDGPVPPAAPVVHKTQNYDEARQGKMVESLKLDSHQDLQIEEKVHYADAAAAARAAVESADHAVAAARAAAELAVKETEHGKANSSKITAPTAGNVEDGSGTNFDIDINDGHDRAPISTEMSQGRYASETMPLPNSDFGRVDDNNSGPLKENDVPHGQDAGGMLTGTPMKLQFDAPEYDDDDQNRKGSEDSIFYQSETAERHAFQHTGEGKFAVIASNDQDLNGGGFSESQDDKLRWQSTELKEPSGRFDIFDINLAGPVNSYSAFSSSDTYFGKTSGDADPKNFSSGFGGSYDDQETQTKGYFADENQRSFKSSQERREDSPLFDEGHEGSSESLEHSQVGAAPSQSGFVDQYD